MTPRSFPSGSEADLSDVAEQGRPVVDEGDEQLTPSPIEDPEVPDADAIEQSRSVPIDEDDYR
jgi:hypothetical protein